MCWIVPVISKQPFAALLSRFHSVLSRTPCTLDFMADYFGTKKHFILKEKLVPFLSFECHIVAENLLTLISVFSFLCSSRACPSVLYSCFSLSLSVCVKHIVPGAVKSTESILCNFTQNRQTNLDESLRVSVSEIQSCDQSKIKSKDFIHHQQQNTVWITPADRMNHGILP